MLYKKAEQAEREERKQLLEGPYTYAHIYICIIIAINNYVNYIAFNLSCSIKTKGYLPTSSVEYERVFIAHALYLYDLPKIFE